jgi:hypothetical protein
VVPAFDAKPLLVPILATFVVALGVAAISPLASVVIFFAGGYGIVGYGHLKQRKLLPPRPELPQATVLDYEPSERNGAPAARRRR